MDPCIANNNTESDICYGRSAPFFSAAPHFRSSVLAPQKLILSKLNVQSDEQHRGLGMQNDHFAQQEWHSDDIGLRSLLIQK